MFLDSKIAVLLASVVTIVVAGTSIAWDVRKNVKAVQALSVAPLEQAANVAPPEDRFQVRLVEVGYHTFNILQIGPDKFLALAQSEGEFSAEKFAAGLYKEAYVGSSVEEVKAQIPGEDPPVRLIEAGYHKFNILQIGPGKFLALAQSEGEFSPEKFAAGGYKQAYVGSSVEEVKAKIDSEEQGVRLIEEGYRGFNILQIGPHRFLALAQSDGSYSAEKLAAGGYKEAYVGSSVEEVKAKIPGEPFQIVLVEQGYRGFNILQIAPHRFVALKQGEGEFSPDKLEKGEYATAVLGSTIEEVRAKLDALLSNK